LKEKNVKTMKYFLALACVLGLVASCMAQNADTDVPTKKMPGIQDARAAALRALKAHDLSTEDSTGEVSPPATTPSTGKFVFNIKINVNPGLPTTSKIFCSASAATAESVTLVSFVDDGAVVATRSGSTATCSITLPYGWFLATPTKDPVGLGIAVTSLTGSSSTPPNQTGESLQSLHLPAVPANGATTTEAITISI
jgi:hypothetical protein